MDGKNNYLSALKEAKKKNADLKKVFHLLQAAVDAGNVDAAYAIGNWYLHGKYVKKNMHLAIKMLRNAVRGLHAQAFFDLAVCYEKGKGVKKNFRLAAENYLQAALYGDTDAVYEVGRCYYYGIGFQQNRRVANIWLDKAHLIKKN